MSFTGTATALTPLRGLGRGEVVDQVTLLTSKVSVCTKSTLTALLVPPLVTTVTSIVPGRVNELVPLPAGTVTTTPVSDHPGGLGTTVALIPLDDCVNTTWPGELRKPLPLISIGSPTGLEGLVELLTFKMEGTGSFEEPLQPKRNATAPMTASARAAVTHESRCQRIEGNLKQVLTGETP